MKKYRLLFVLISLLALLCVCASAKDFEKSLTYTDNFTDVPKGAWYAESVASVYEIALMEGVSENVFDTESEMNVAQAITIAARLHSIYNEKDIPDAEGGRWYQKYVNYCIDNGIMTKEQFDSFSRSVLSYEMVELFAAALPEEFYPPVNNVESVHDVPETLSFHDDVLKFYNAGILNGNDENGTFLPMSAITRKRAAVIISRVAIQENRLTFTLKDIKENLNIDEFLLLMSKHAATDTLDSIILAQYGEYKISAAIYRYFLFASGNDVAKAEEELKRFIAIKKSLRDLGVTIPKELYGELLAVNYAERLPSSYNGSTYNDALEAQRLSDSAWVHISGVYNFYKLFAGGYGNNVSEQEVYSYAIENNYIHTTHIFISNETEDAYRLALEILLRIKSGEDFDKLRQEYGQDTGLSARDTGYFFTHGQMPKEYEDAAFSLGEGEMLEFPLETELGYHIIKRLPYTMKELLSSPDYTTIEKMAEPAVFNKKTAQVLEQITFTYAENFDGLIKILN